MVSRELTEKAKNRAIRKTFGLIFWSFIVALLVAFGLPHLFDTIYSSRQDDATKSTVTVLTSITLSLLWMWVSSEVIKNTVGKAVGEAVKDAANQELQTYKDQHPNVKRAMEMRQREYVCRIPRGQESEYSVQRDQSICNRKTGRDAVTRSLSYNDKLLFHIASRSVQGVLRKHRGGRTQLEHEALEEIFANDVYVYLRGWLITSITHDCDMPISYITDRYPDEQSPNKEAYIEAFSTAQYLFTRNTRLRSRMNEILDNEEHTGEAIKLLDEYLGRLKEIFREKGVHPE